jgi:hypothetical protein
MTNGCQKGKRGEREAAKAITKVLGVNARRGQQHTGLEGEEIVADVPDTHFEVKRVERFNLYEALSQSVRDAKEAIPVVLHRKNRQPWVAVVRVQDLLRFAKAILATQ